MIGQTLVFWLVSTLPALLAWPLVWRSLRGLPDHGFGLTRSAGILISAYLYWIACTAGFIPNNIGGVLGILFILGAMSAGVLIKEGREFQDWIRQKSMLLVIQEVIFLAVFIFWAFVRANNPDIVATEKPMELAFLNSILISPQFPPQDPWLSGYAISYYYFGYVMIAMLTKLSGLASGVTFNLANALWFALIFSGTYSLLYNLLRNKKENSRRILSLLAPFFVVIAGNLEGFLEVLHRRMFFWSTMADGNTTSTFWNWLGIKQLTDPPTGSLGWLPDRYLWWWRASRVVNDIDLSGREVEVIDEFPFFSFILADNHPHVLALPFVLLAVAFALHVFYRGGKSLCIPGGWNNNRILRKKNFGLMISGLAALSLLLTISGSYSGSGAIIYFLRTWVLSTILVSAIVFLYYFLHADFPRCLTIREFLFAAVLFGGLAFLNTWDLPIYLTLLLGVLIYNERGATAVERIAVSAAAGVAVLLGAAILYLPWLAGFRSQLGGILPNLIYPTRFVQFLIMFGVFIVPISIWIVRENKIVWKRSDSKLLLAVGTGLPLLLWGVSLGLSGLIRSVFQNNPQQIQDLISSMGAANLDTLVQAVLDRRAAAGWTSIFLGLLIAGALLLFIKAAESHTDTSEEARNKPFILLLIGIGGLLVLGAEFLYLRDLFSTRMNTVFKFYYATWILWGLAASWIAAIALQRTGWFYRLLSVISITLLFGGLVYSSLAVWTKTNGFNPSSGRTLDGTAYLEQSSSDYAAIEWMKENLTSGIIVEAVGGSYSQFGRISAHTGFPTVIGWPFHEYQWRGTLDFSGSREADVQRLYETRSWEEAYILIQQYDIGYVYVGSLERQKYKPLVENKFTLNLKLIYSDESVNIYRVSEMEVP